MQLRRVNFAFLAVVLLVLGSAPTRSHGASAVTFPTPTTPSTVSSRFDVGFDFTVSIPLMVTALSFYDFNADGLAVSHAVGLFTRDALSLVPLTLAQVTVTTMSPLLDSFRYVTITPLTLVPGVTYTMGAFTQTNAQSPGDVFFSQVANVSFAPGFVLGEAKTSQIDQDGLVQPTVSASYANQGFFGPSLLVQPIPEPATWAMVCGAVGTLLGLQRVRRRRAAR